MLDVTIKSNLQTVQTLRTEKGIATNHNPSTVIILQLSQIYSAACRKAAVAQLV
jgi:hypothetical protein